MLKFRAWNKLYRSFVYLELLDKGLKVEAHGFPPMPEPKSPVATDIYYQPFAHPDNLPWQQYAGYKAKSGREIYEGDILKVSQGGFSATGRVEYKDACFRVPGITSLIPSPPPLLSSVMEAGKVKVVGHIYERSEPLDRPAKTQPE